MIDKSHIESDKEWAEFVRTAPRSEWKKYLNVLINSQYQKANAFYERLEKTDQGREILERLKQHRIKNK